MLSAQGSVQMEGISSTWTSISVISSYHLREPGRLSAAVGTSEPSHRAWRSPDGDATDTGTFGGRGDTPLTQRTPRLRRRKLPYQLVKRYFGKNAETLLDKEL